MTVGAILQASSYGLPQLIAGRLITGFGNGMVCLLSPQAERLAAYAQGRTHRQYLPIREKRRSRIVVDRWL